MDVASVGCEEVDMGEKHDEGVTEGELEASDCVELEVQVR